MIANLKDLTVKETVRLTYRGWILTKWDKKDIGYTREIDRCRSSTRIRGQNLRPIRRFARSVAAIATSQHQLTLAKCQLLRIPMWSGFVVMAV